MTTVYDRAVEYVTERARAAYGGTDGELVERAVRIAAARRSRLPRWALVKRALGVGSTSAAALCRRFDIDPDSTEAQR